MTDNWTPEDHLAGQPSLWFEDMKVGMRYPLPSRTMTSGIFAAFQAASGDNDPIHYDKVYCQARGHKDLLAHGMQNMIQAIGGAGNFPEQTRDSLVAFIGVSANFLKPVYLGDTLYSELVVSEVIPQNTTGVIVMKALIRNQDGVLVLEGEHRYLIRKRG